MLGMICVRERKLRYKVKWIVTTMFVVVVILSYIFPVFITAGTSMLPTLLNNDWLIGTRFFTPERGDVVVCLIKDSNGNMVRAVKRIVAVGGDSVVVTNESVTVNGIILEEPYTYDAINGTTFSGTVADDQYFVLGDNRLASYDSRSAGSVSENCILTEIIYDVSGFHTVH